MRSAWTTGFALLLAALLSLSVVAQDQPEPEAKGKQDPPDKKQDGNGDARKKAEQDKFKEELYRQYTYAKLRELKQVWIEANDASVASIVEEFRKQTGFNIVLMGENIPEGYKVKEFIVRNAPFREAFDHFLKVAELVIVDETANIIRIERPIMMSLSVTDSDIKDVLSLIAKVSGANIVMAPERITGKVTLNIKNVPWTEILDNVVKTLGYTTVRENYSIIRIISPDELVRQMETKVFKLRYIAPAGTYTAKFESNKYVEGRPLTPATTVEERERRFLFLKIVEATLSTDASGQQLGKSFFGPGRNAIIVRDTKPVLDRISKVIETLDTEPEMVMIGLKFLSTRNEDLLNWGTAWFGIDQLGVAVDGIGVLSRTTPFATGVPGINPSPIPPATPLTQPNSAFPLSTATQQILGRLPFGIGSSDPAIKPFYWLTEYDQRALFRAFKRDQYTKLLQEPTISVLDNTEATIFVGESVPYAVARVVIVPGAPTQTSVEPGPGSPVKVGFQVLVVPRILKEENQVIMTVIPENIVLSGTDVNLPGFERFTVAGQDIVLPRTAESTIVTRLKIDNNQTAVIGGLMVERITITNRGIPGLMDIPILNFLFKDKSESKTREHLLIFVTPKIVRNRKDMSEQLNAQRRLKAAQIEQQLQRLKSLRGN